MKRFGILAIVALAIGLMTSGVGVHGIGGLNDSTDGPGGDIGIAGSARDFPRPDYDSGWVPVPPGRIIHVEHNLGGKPDDYVIDMQSKSDLTQDITNEGCGGDMYYVDTVKDKGYYYTNLTSRTIGIARSGDDYAADLLRVRIWACVPAAGCAADFAPYKPPDEDLFPSNIRPGQMLYMTFGGANEGTEAIAPGWRIRYFASRDTIIYQYNGDTALYETTADFGIAPGQRMTFTEAFVMPDVLPPGEYYIGWIFDPDDEVCEANDNNNWGCITGTKLTVLAP